MTSFFKEAPCSDSNSDDCDNSCCCTTNTARLSRSVTSREVTSSSRPEWLRGYARCAARCT